MRFRIQKSGFLTPALHSNDFTFVEAAVSKAKEALQSSNRTRSNVYTQITELTSKTGDLIAKQNKEQEESDKLTREINDAIRLQDVRRDHLSHVPNELKEAIKEKVHCEFKNIVGAVSHVLLEAHEAVCINNLALKQDATITGNRVKHFVIGSVLSVGTAAVEAWKEATETLSTETSGRVQKEFAYNRIDSFSSGGDKLRTDLETALAETQKAQKGDKTYLSQLQVSAQKFGRMCDRYLSRIGNKGKDPEGQGRLPGFDRQHSVQKSAPHRLQQLSGSESAAAGRS